ncbi:hypothetical protein NKH77_38870 [Streptomyces sp. M19]
MRTALCLDPEIDEIVLTGGWSSGSPGTIGVPCSAIWSAAACT